MRVAPNGSLVVTCREMTCLYRGVRLYHAHFTARHMALAINRVVGRKQVKIVMIKGHFAVVDHTWERND